MKIVVCVKQIGTLGDEVEFVDENRAVDPDYIEYAMNEWDTYAVEAALEIAGEAGEVVAVTVGDEGAEAVLRRCLAMGVGRARRIVCDTGHDALAPARALAPAVREERPDLVLCGAQSADGAHAATAAALAALLDLPCVAVVREIQVNGDVATVRRELEGGVAEVLDVVLPAVLSVQTGINTPRYATLRAIRQAEAQEILVDTCEPARSTRVRTLRTPERDSSMATLGSDPAAIATRIAELVKERRR
jgi:electron transfer flavoprotein beta subunit